MTDLVDEILDLKQKKDATILAHYYQVTAIGSTSPTQRVRVLPGTGGAGPPTVTGASWRCG